MARTRTLSDAGPRRTLVTQDADGWTIHGLQRTDQDETFAKYRNSLVSDWGPNRWRGDMHHVATVPHTVAERYLGEMRNGRFVWHDESYIKRWLDDPDNRVWRTKPGKIG